MKTCPKCGRQYEDTNTLCPTDGTVPVPEDALPVRLPEDVEFRGAHAEGNPLATSPTFVNTTCPTCGGALLPRGQTTRAVTVRENQTVTLRRGYAVCSACGAGVSPPR